MDFSGKTKVTKLDAESFPCSFSFLGPLALSACGCADGVPGVKLHWMGPPGHRPIMKHMALPHFLGDIHGIVCPTYHQ